MNVTGAPDAACARFRNARAASKPARVPFAAAGPGGNGEAAVMARRNRSGVVAVRSTSMC